MCKNRSIHRDHACMQYFCLRDSPGMTKVEGTAIREPRERLCRMRVAPFLAAEPNRPRGSVASRTQQQLWSTTCATAQCEVPFGAILLRPAQASFVSVAGIDLKAAPRLPSKGGPWNSTQHRIALSSHSSPRHLHAKRSNPPSVIRQALFPYTSNIPNDTPSSRALLTIALLPAVDPRTHLRAQAPY
jgi:hypothetical protein